MIPRSKLINLFKVSPHYCKINNNCKLVKIREMSSTIIEQKKTIENQQLNFIKISAKQSSDNEKFLMLLPGALGTIWTDFKPQIEQLPTLLPNYNIIAWDPPGYGKSVPPNRNFTTNFYADDAEMAHKLMKSFDIQKYSVLGWSDGGITGLIMAGTFQDNIDKLIIWGSSSYISDEDVKLIESIRDTKNWSPRMRDPFEKIYGVDDFPILWNKWVDTQLEIYKSKNGDFCKTILNKIDAPTFILHGAKDNVVAAEHVPYLQKSLKNVEYYEFVEGKHNIHLKYSEEFNKIIAEFLVR